MTLRNAQSLLFNQIKSRLPSDCWAIQAGDLNDGEFDEEIVLVHEGTLHVPTLDLDHLTGGEADDAVFLLLVEGDLIVDHAIYNEETDGATGLIVTGNVRARHLIVGGQEIYVGGDLNIRELLWGDYNHGDLIVRGDAKAKIWAQTDGYRSTVDGTTTAALRVNEWEDAVVWFAPGPLQGASIFRPEFLIDEETGEPSREQAIYQQEQSLFLREFEEFVEPSEDTDAPPEVNIDGLIRLTEPSLMPAEPLEDEEAYTYQFYLNDLYLRGVLDIDDGASTPNYRGVYLEQSDEYAVLIETPPGQPGTVFARVRHLEGADTQWYQYDDRVPEPFRQLYHIGWQAMHAGVSMFERTRQLLEPAMLRELLALPLVEPYDDYYDDDRNGFWSGDLYYAFQQEDDEHYPMLKIGREVEDDEGEERMEAYYYEIEPMLDGSEAISVSYTPDDDADEEDDEELDLNYVGGDHLKEGLRLFFVARKQLLRSNAELLEGRPPHDPDKFAVRHWRKQGYLKSKL